MKDSSKIWLGVGVTAIVSLGGYLAYKRFINPTNIGSLIEEDSAEQQLIDQATNLNQTANRPPSGSSGSSSSTSLTSCQKTAKYPILVGAEGGQIKNIQKFINQFHPDGDKVAENCKLSASDIRKLYDIKRRGGKDGKGISFLDVDKITEGIYNRVIMGSLRTGNLESSALNWW